MDEEDSIMLIYTWADSCLRHSQFADVDARLRRLQPEVLGILLSLAWLSITHAAAHELHEFAAYRSRVVAYINAVDPDRAESLLRGL